MKKIQKQPIGTLVNIQDSKSLFNGKSGMIADYLGNDVLVVLVIEGVERHILVKNGKFEILNEQ